MSGKESVLVFGPTGAVGRAAALEAHRRGASVWLAMRDIKKPLNGIDDPQAGFTRIQADLSKPDTLIKAVKQSLAKKAFVYTLFDSPDFMASAFEALVSAGVTYIVILSSWSVKGEANQESNMKQFIPRLHAKAEVALQATGIPYAAVRPGFFASNIYWNTQDIKNGTVELLYQDVQFDYIAPSDIGTASGAILSTPSFQVPNPGAASHIVYLCGPQLLTQQQAHDIIAEKTGRELKAKALSEEEWRAKLQHLPKQVLDDMSENLKASHERVDAYPKDLYEEAKENVRRYTGSEGMGFAEWVEENKGAFV